MTITIQGTGIDLTEALKQYATDKIESLSKFHDHIVKVEIDIGMRTHHHNKGKIFYAEVNLHVPKLHTIRVTKDAEDLYKAIDKVKDHLKIELEKLKGKQKHKDRNAIRAQKEFVQE